MQLELSNSLFRDVMKFANAENISVKSKITHLLEVYVNTMKNNEDCHEGMQYEDLINDRTKRIGETAAR